MRTALTLAAVLALTASSAFAATAPRCHDAKGRFTKCPMAAAAPAAQASHATCKDGTAWTGKSHQGACSRHGGVKTWS